MPRVMALARSVDRYRCAPRGRHDLHLLGHLGAGDHRVHVAPPPVQRVAQVFGGAYRVWCHTRP
ncbi:hypothetical protein BST45_16850 [Mycobacterium shinjukuense]|nr:hypothetical protein BST45_16850 [Mycobacterium shinjukuense]